MRPGSGARQSRIFEGLPSCPAGSQIGLYGGSFNPPHEGHRRASLLALRRCRLDQVWWLVTPGNPLKDSRNLPPLAERMRQAALVAAHPRLFVTGVEALWSTRYSADLLAHLIKRLPSVRFVWIFGSDNLMTFHLWRHWRQIADLVPIAVINRPGWIAAPLSAPAALALAAWRIPDRDAPGLTSRRPPVWVFLTGPRSDASSTALRDAEKLVLADAGEPSPIP